MMPSYVSLNKKDVITLKIKINKGGSGVWENYYF